VTTSTSPPLLVRQRDLGSHDEPGPDRVPPSRGLLRWGRPALLPLSSVVRAETGGTRVLGLTYDDGPHPEETPELLDELDARGVRASFFVLAKRAEEAPELVARMLAAGHDVGLHGVDHRRLSGLGPRKVRRILTEGRDRLRAVTGTPVRLYRPTYGAESVAQHVAATRLGMEVVNWSAWARDWLDAPADVVAGRALAARHPGAILLLHDTTDDTELRPTFSRVEVLRLLLDGLAADGYSVLPVSDLLARHRAVRAMTVRRGR